MRINLPARHCGRVPALCEKRRLWADVNWFLRCDHRQRCGRLDGSCHLVRRLALAAPFRFRAESNLARRGYPKVLLRWAAPTKSTCIRRPSDCYWKSHWWLQLARGAYCASAGLSPRSPEVSLLSATSASWQRLIVEHCRPPRPSGNPYYHRHRKSAWIHALRSARILVPMDASAPLFDFLNQSPIGPPLWGLLTISATFPIKYWLAND